MIRFVSAAAVASLFAGSLAGYPPPPKEKPEEPPPPATQADWQKSINNLKRIGVAFHSYRDTNGFFPADATDKNGKVLLSWRVQILPYLEQDDLYKQFKLDEAWDSADNKKLLGKLPTAFAPVRVKGKPGMTYYQGFDGQGLNGPGTMFDPSNRRISVRAIPDGLSNTCLLVEAATAVEWTKPYDMPFDGDKDLPKLGGHFDGDFVMLMCDGSVLKVKKDFDPVTMKAVITRNGGEVYDLKGIKK